MINCLKCKRNFSTYLKIDGELKNLSNRKYCLDCSPYKKHNTRKLENASIVAKCKEELPITKLCNLCKLILPSENFGIYFHKDRWKIFSYCKICDSKRLKDKSFLRKKKSVDYKGGKCELCGYNKSYRALEFHHIISEQKELLISRFRLKDWSIIVPELDKCKLLCANCHREEHDRLENDIRRVGM